jgi:hypothetical protein
MAGTSEIVRNFNSRLGIRRKKNEPRTPLECLVPQASASPIEGVLSALLVTLGLLCGILAITPQQALVHVPLIHVAVAFFVPFATLFALTELTLREVSRAMLQGLIMALIIGSATLVASTSLRRMTAVAQQCAVEQVPEHACQ